MRNIFALSAAALALTASFASADTNSVGLQQIANYLGVDAGAYSATELHELLAARNDGDQSTYAYLLDQENRSTSEALTPGKAQIAAQVGLDPSQYSTAELAMVQDALRDGDQQAANFVISHQNRNNYYFPQPEMGRDS